MKIGKVAILGFGVMLITSAVLLIVYVLPIVTKVNEDLKVYETRVAYRDDYKLHTTPLPESVVEDMCLKFGIKGSSEHCQPNAVVYAPDLFDELKIYFGDLPDQDKTYEVVQEILGSYTNYCEPPYPDGSYVCHYDLRGDNIYPILFFFDKNGMYYRIIANTGGS